ncbi:accessory Sec system protein Asp3 [Enterococcus mundtii]|uniref:Accessory Sec system protein Asp3 n=1 Tax=Enterococcus mundtii TaxID=53346 RepID=A0A242KUL6_ENTMU|nr:accessory Sec system protein Asp3 [Enterococcus mundtii]OTP24839.1 accessory Sec system protein Asp3 [Enterococcus mundtii]
MDFDVKWTRNLSDIYKYGSTITYKNANQVCFENELLSPGVPIVKWVSNSYYQKERTLVQLPLLERKKKYYLSTDLQVFPARSLLIKVTFFNRLGKPIGRKVFTEKGGEFTYLNEAFSYSIELVSIGLKKLLFNHLKIWK